MSLSIRPAVSQDIPSLLEMVDALNAASGLKTGLLEGRKFRSAMFGRNAFLFGEIAEIDGDLAGYALSHDAFSTDYGERGLYMVDLYVDAAHRREGVGKALMRAVCKRARRRGGDHVWWASIPRNYQARRFYDRLGASNDMHHIHAVYGKAFEKLASVERPRQTTRRAA